ncbi:MAG TPA: DNA adenine methylase [Acidimicrobiales bacterium]|nr:DNA adenine methylase [Acidimicrobiales bacterium]
MKPPIAYFGGKTRLAPWIAALMPPHRVYVEPFAGSAAVLFAKPRSTHEVINDLDGQLVNFFRVLREQPDEMERLCRLTPYARDEFAAAAVDAEALSDVERARRWWVRSSQSFAQTGGHNTGWSTSVKRGSNNARSAWNRIERFAAAAERLACVTIENRDALEVVQAYDDPAGVVYADPPYLGSTRSSFCDANGWSRRPAGDYAHEFSTDEDHRALAGVLGALRATVFLSGYSSALYDEIYAGWWRLDRQVLCRASNGRSGSNGYRTEVLWCNRPIDGRLGLDEGLA